jgi:hypothetical protein
MFAELASGALSGAATGATIGGPIGAGVGALAGGALGYMSANSTADAQAAARQAAAIQARGLRKGIGAEKKGTKKAVGYLKPYSESGQGANTLLSDALGINGPEAQARYFANFQNDPGYIAARDAGIAGIEQSQAGPGMLHSGGTLKALQDYGQRLVWSQFQNRLEGLRGLGVQGQNAATTQGGWQTQFGRDKADMLGQIGTARASGIVGAANAGTAGTQNMLQLAGYGIGAASNYANRNDLANYFKSQQAPTTGWDSWTTMG